MLFLDPWTFDCVLVIRHFDFQIWHKIVACLFKIRTQTKPLYHSACNSGVNDTATGGDGGYLRANGAAMNDHLWARR